MYIEYRIYIVEGKTTLSFPFNSIKQAEKHIKYLESVGSGTQHHEVHGYTIAPNPTLVNDEWGDERWSWGTHIERENELVNSRR